jgi:hypothetical protein
MLFLILIVLSTSKIPNPSEEGVPTDDYRGEDGHAWPGVITINSHYSQSMLSSPTIQKEFQEFQAGEKASHVLFRNPEQSVLP